MNKCSCLALVLILVLTAFTACREEEKEAGKVQKEKKMNEEVYAVFETSMGDIKIRLFPDKAPKTVENFIGLATGEKAWVDPRSLQKINKPLYDGTIFHRVIPKFMIQGGDPKGNGTGGPGYRFEDEFHPSLRFDRAGLLAMANAGPNTNGSQFFLCTVETSWLNGRHVVFGSVVEGMDVVKKVEGFGTGSGAPKAKILIADCGQL